MSATAALDYTYSYRYPSNIGDFGKGFGLHLATCSSGQSHPYFFEGDLRHPRCVGETLLVLSNIVHTHFFRPVPTNLDPVVTSSESMLRFEGFSGCGGVYVQADFEPQAFRCDLQKRRTTNVDFNASMRALLTRLGEQEQARLSVGQEEVALTHGRETTVEKKVKLPVR